MGVACFVHKQIEMNKLDKPCIDTQWYIMGCSYYKRSLTVAGENTSISLKLQIIEVIGTILYK